MERSGISNYGATVEDLEFAVVDVRCGRFPRKEVMMSVDSSWHDVIIS